jgi:ABC-type multidrug transport system ATPase subunit
MTSKDAVRLSFTKDVHADLKTTPTTIACRDVRYAVPFVAKPTSKKDKKADEKERRGTTKTILRDVSALFRPGRLTAVMGASGAGKTSLLNFLAGHVAAKADLSGTVLLNGHVVTPRELKTVTAFVFQDDVILDTMTVREAIEMSALLRLPKSVTKEERHRRVQAIIVSLQLQACQHTRIGNQWQKGVSGGERKRTAIAMDLVVNPAVLMLDEPTSGLDTFTAFNVVQSLSSLARIHHRTIVATLHQPSSEIFHLLDDLVLLSGGLIVYHGPAAGVVDYFARLGFPCPQYTNPADHVFMRVLNETAVDDDEDDAQVRARLEKVHSAWPESLEYQALHDSIRAETTADSQQRCQRVMQESAARRAPFSRQFSFLSSRSAKNVLRNFMVAWMRLLQMLLVGFTIGFIFYGIRDKPAMTQSNNRLGALNFYSINLFLGSSMGVVTTFVNEKNVFQREYVAGYYATLPYYLAKVLVELPHQLLAPMVALLASYFLIGFRSGVLYFLRAYLVIMSLSLVGVGVGTLAGAVFKDINRGMMILSMLLLPFIVFSGLIVNNFTLPWALKWVPYICPTWYAFTALARNELTDYVFPGCKAPPSIPEALKGSMPDMYIDCTGNSTLRINDLNKSPAYSTSVLVLLGMYAGFMLLSYVALWRMARSRSLV